MKVVMTLLVRDEADIVAANLDHHLEAGVDHVIATDNRSTDGTVDILAGYEAAGVLDLIHEADDDYSQARWVTRMARLAATDHGADWVINNDADEFWWAPGHDLPALLADVPAEVRAVRAERANFLARPESAEPFWRRMTVRQRPSQPHPGMDWPTLGPKVCHRAHPRITVAQGNHAVALEGEPAYEPATDTGLEILHFPVRSRRQFENKIVLGGAAYARNTELPEEVGKIWRDLYATHRDGRFDEAWQRCVLDEAELAAGLADGSLLEDSRVADRLTALGAAA